MAGIDRRTLVVSAAAASLGAGAAAARNRLDTESIVRAAAEIIRAQYVDPVEANRVADDLLARLAAGAYRTNSTTGLSRKLTEDLRAWTKDIHMEVFYQPQTVAQEDPAEITEDYQHPRTTGWGVQTVARLQGNIGLLRVTHFPSPPVPRVAPRYAAAMELLQDTAALVLDLTINHGGGTDSYGFFLSYFLDGEIEFSRMAWRNDPLEIIRSSPDAPGPHYGEARPLFVAISGDTFSAGEAVALELKKRGRATLVGRRTKGGASGGNYFDLPGDFRIFVVMGRTEGPNWDGAGVTPHVLADPAAAVAVAHKLALAELSERETDPTRTQILRNVRANSIENLSSFNFAGRQR